MSRWRRASQLITELGSQVLACGQLQQTRGFKSVNTKLPVVLLKDVNGLGPSGKATAVKRGYARNYLIPQRLVEVEQKARADAAAGAVGTKASQGASFLDEESRLRREAMQRRRRVELLISKLTTVPITLKRRTQADSNFLEHEITSKDITDAIARQMRIQMVPDLLELGSDTLAHVGEYRIPLKLVLPSGQRATLDVNVVAT